MREMYGSNWDLNLGYRSSPSGSPRPKSCPPPPSAMLNGAPAPGYMDIEASQDMTAGLGFGFGASAVDVNSLSGLDGRRMNGVIGRANNGLVGGCLGMVSTPSLRLVSSPRVQGGIEGLD